MVKVFNEWIVRLDVEARSQFSASLHEFSSEERHLVPKRASANPLRWHCRDQQKVVLSSRAQKDIEHTIARIQSLQVGIDLRAFGSQLARVLLPGRLRATIGDALRSAGENNHVLRLRIDVRDEALRDWPWEFIFFEPAESNWQGEFLATDPIVSLVRQSEAGPPSLKSQDGRPIRCLVVWADVNPETANLDRAGGVKEIFVADTAFRSALAQNLEVHYLGGQRSAPRERWSTRENIFDMLERGTWDAVFFVCHGEPGRLLVESPTKSDGAWLTGEELASSLSKAGVQVAMINACGSVGGALSRAIPIVLAMQFPVTLPTAARFWREFFAWFALPMPIDLCALAARQELENVGSSFPDWGTPVMYRGRVTEDANVITTSPNSTKRRVADVVRQLARSSAVRGAARNQIRTTPSSELLGHLRGPEAAGVPWPWTPDIIRVFRKTDPWQLLLLGPSTAAAWSEPIWWTSLRDFPQRLRWPNDPAAVSYSIEIDDGMMSHPLILESRESFVPIDGHLLPDPKGRAFRWTVTTVRPHDFREIWIRGVFRVLTAADQATIRDSQILADSQDVFGRYVALTEAWIGMQLYDDAIRLLRGLLRQHDDGGEGYIVRRLLGHVFKEMHDRMNFDCHWIGPEVAWSGAENERWMQLAYCAALGRVGQCQRLGQSAHRQSCPHCGSDMTSASATSEAESSA